jgi:hypothetical protein
MEAMMSMGGLVVGSSLRSGVETIPECRMEADGRTLLKGLFLLVE